MQINKAENTTPIYYIVYTNITEEELNEQILTKILVKPAHDILVLILFTRYKIKREGGLTNFECLSFTSKLASR